MDVSLGLSGSMAQQTESPFTITTVFPGACVAVAVRLSQLLVHATTMGHSVYLVDIAGIRLCCAGIIDPALDAFVELLRLQTLGRAGLHQVQLDVHAIRQMLSRWGFFAEVCNQEALDAAAMSCAPR